MIPSFLCVEPIGASAFAPYGNLLEKPLSGKRQNFAAQVENLRASARANLAIIRSEPFAMGTPITILERHPFSTQFFAPLDVDAYLVVVAKDAGDRRPDMASLRAFQVGAHQAINYNSGTWHAGMATLGRPGLFAMLVHEDGSPADCEYLELPQALVIKELG
jgi:ureidoglycolate lyase